jgi:hypothetical protein
VGATSKKDKVHITITIKNEDTANRLVLREIDEARARPVAVLNSSQSEANRKIYKKHNKEEEEEKVDSFQNFCECLRDFFFDIVGRGQKVFRFRQSHQSGRFDVIIIDHSGQRTAQTVSFVPVLLSSPIHTHSLLEGGSLYLSELGLVPSSH